MNDKDHNSNEGMVDTVDNMTSTLRSNIKTISPDTIRQFIESQSDVVGEVVIEPLGSAEGLQGAANGIQLFSARVDFGEGPVKLDLVLRYKSQAEKRTFMESDWSAQFHIQKQLQHTDVPTPRAYWIDEDGSQLGSPGYIMDYVDGVVPDSSYFSSGLIADASAESKTLIFTNILNTLAKIHDVDCDAIGMPDISKPAEGNNPVEKYINWYWDLACWVDPPEKSELELTRDFLINNQPPLDKPVLIHGDASCHNYIFDKDNTEQVIAVIDWELASIGAPEQDLTFQYIIIDLFSNLKGGIDGVPSLEEYKAIYEKASGRKVEHWDYYYKMAAYSIIIVMMSMRKNLPPETPADIAETNAGFIDMFWDILRR